MTEIVTNGTTLRLIERRQPAEIRDLGPNQLAWCKSKWPFFDKNRVQRAAEAYRLAELEQARVTISETV